MLDRARSLRWVVLAGFGVVMGSMPITISGMLELLTMVVTPFVIGFLIARWWTGVASRIALAVLVGLFASVLKLLSTSLQTGKNWFTYVGGLVTTVGIGDPVVRTMVLVTLFPVMVTLLTTATFIILGRLGPRSEPMISLTQGKRK